MTLRHFTLRLGASLLRICGALALVALLALVYTAAITQMPSRSHRGPLPLASAEQAALAQRLRQHVVAVASVEHNLRNRLRWTRPPATWKLSLFRTAIGWSGRSSKPRARKFATCGSRSRASARQGSV
ncbi:hypothetical protein LJR129_000036 [Acidovorax sp. LjRoot129]|uniref:hypothetical protein n=1 Tax=Acidovorax sp. LjRoot129 TaxID=3342260 RepID=UPI003ECF8B67